MIGGNDIDNTWIYQHVAYTADALLSDASSLKRAACPEDDGKNRLTKDETFLA
ncbi:MAG: hypothetical protein P8130_15105 [Deltaproteobacteria bacterium]